MKEIGHDNHAFADDTGAADPALAAALSAYTAEETDLEPVVAALAAARVLVPVVAVLGETEHSTLTGLTTDKNADMALVLLTSPQGQQALPVFTGMESLQRWNADARPVPVAARLAALSGVDEGCELIVIDPSGPDTAVLPRTATWALAQGREWKPSSRDPQVHAEIDAALRQVPAVLQTRCLPGKKAELAVAVQLTPGLTREQLKATTDAISTVLSQLPLVAERVASLELSLH